jgi:outer membrane receptor for ferric coprogen and ferric-rhodotorulic acid
MEASKTENDMGHNSSSKQMINSIPSFASQDWPRGDAGIDLRSGPWLLRGEVQLVDKAKLGENETVQAGGYSLVNLMVQYQHGRHVWFIKGTNLTDRLAYNANTVDEVRQFVPVAGRAVQAGVRVFY